MQICKWEKDWSRVPPFVWRVPPLLVQRRPERWRRKRKLVFEANLAHFASDEAKKLHFHPTRLASTLRNCISFWAPARNMLPSKDKMPLKYFIQIHALSRFLGIYRHLPRNWRASSLAFGEFVSPRKFPGPLAESVGFVRTSISAEALTQRELHVRAALREGDLVRAKWCKGCYNSTGVTQKHTFPPSDNQSTEKCRILRFGSCEPNMI